MFSQDLGQISREFDAFMGLVWSNKIKHLELDFYGKMEEDYKKINDLNEILNNNPSKYSSEKRKHIQIVNKSGATRDEYEGIRQKLANCEVLFGFQECEQMLEILKKLDYINEQNIPLLKTRIARELGGGEENIYLVELIVENILDPLDPAEIVALVSIFVAHGRSKNEPNVETMEIPDTLREAILQVQDIYKKINDMEKAANIATEFELNLLIVKAVYEWGMGREFIEICEHTEVLEGAVVRSIQRVEQTMKSIQRALAQVGNSTLVEKVQKGSEIIKRGIAFASSLYLDQNMDLTS